VIMKVVQCSRTILIRQLAGPLDSSNSLCLPRATLLTGGEEGREGLITCGNRGHVETRRGSYIEPWESR
jgi:uncharacterized protein (DUF779 family)